MIEYYKNLLIMQYRDKPKALETIGLMTSIILQDNILLKVLSGFDPETAVGKQLDILGKWIGIDRFYSDGALSDADYKVILEFKSISNSLNMSPSAIDNILFDFFGNNIICSSEENLRIYYFIEESIFDLAEILLEKKVLPKPLGIRLIGLIKNDIWFGLSNFATFLNDIPSKVAGLATYDNFLTKEGKTLTYNDIYYAS